MENLKIIMLQFGLRGIKMFSENDTPLLIVKFREKQFPNIYNTIEDTVHSVKKKHPEIFREYCSVPISASFTILTDIYKQKTESAALLAAEIAALTMWRKNKIVYDIDDTMSEILFEQAVFLDDTKKIPSAIIKNEMPYECLFVRTGGFGNDILGFLFWLEFDVEFKKTEIRVQLVNKNLNESYPFVIDIVDDGTIGDCVEATKKFSNKNKSLGKLFYEKTNDSDYKRNTEIVLKALQIVLYIISINSDVEENPEQKIIYRQHSGIPKDKFREIKKLDVGVNVGRTIRKNNSEKIIYYGESKNTQHKRSHVRRGHWHHYWTGTADAKKLVLKWTAPMTINSSDADEIIPTIIKT